MSARKEILGEKIRRLVIGKFNLDIEPQDISAEQSLIELGVGVDSVSTLEFIMELEEELGVSIDESEVNLGVLETVESLSEFIISIGSVGKDRT
ncbi:MAG: acyl carrier protein [Candidatus Dadabacteria bacterium]|nr:acyl carrier protein [Candidatus Dadabacteria bacterium]MXW44309.1 acyl carrier protein [Candidatus Dadabacteria bacterium]MXZ48348.1 acyl carrier protein [Candidatus Dadabacteria bacterium]MYB27023.1 acyl carrier protein [Candidatus Dadabacteria bacterium]MYI73372.1 acyl carrier protein [Candidatus Dadabacteria bacterium]